MGTTAATACGGTEACEQGLQRQPVPPGSATLHGALDRGADGAVVGISNCVGGGIPLQNVV